MKNSSKKHSITSQSNGSLMRITPLVLYCLKLENDEDIIQAVRSEVSLTHSNETAQVAAIIWVLTLKEIINTGDPKKSY